MLASKRHAKNNVAELEGLRPSRIQPGIGRSDASLRASGVQSPRQQQSSFADRRSSLQSSGNHLHLVRVEDAQERNLGGGRHREGAGGRLLLGNVGALR